MTDTLRNMPRYIRNSDAFGWQGADNPNGPWRSISPPQSGTPFQTTNPMDDLRQASAEVSGVEVLSPAALSTWGAFCGIVEDHGPPRLALAAALRAAADHLDDHANRLLFGGRYYGMIMAIELLQSIATQLEGND